MQETVSFDSHGLKLSGVVRIPDNAKGKVPAFLLLHGFGSNKEAEWMKLTAELLAGWGYASMRFDFRGCGASEGPPGRTICLEQVEDVKNAVTWLSTQPGIDPKRIGVIGPLVIGKYRKLDEPGLTRAASDKAYKMAGLGPEDIDVAEVHDATSFCEIYQCEMLRFCPEGEGGRFIASGATGPGGKLPVNTSGGLVSKGHPVGATGLSMLAELATQLRGEAGPRQVKGAEIALAENGGGVIGMEEAVASVVILQKV